MSPSSAAPARRTVRWVLVAAVMASLADGGAVGARSGARGADAQEAAGQAQAPAPPDKPVLPPFVGEVVNFDRYGERLAVCADRSGGEEMSVGARKIAATQVWVLDREVLRQLGSSPGSCDPAWSPDGKRLALVTLNGLWTYSPTLDQPRQLAETRAGAAPANEFDYTAFSRPRWSPDGLRIAFLVTNGGTTWVEVVDAHNGRRLFKSEPDTYSFEWTSDPRALKIGNRTVRMQ